MKLNLVSFFALVILIVSCTKTEEIHTPMSQEMKQWCVFNQGSYWIYQNDSTFEIDCVYVASPPVSIVKTYDYEGYREGLTRYEQVLTCEEIQMSLKGGFLSEYLLTSNPLEVECSDNTGMLYFSFENGESRKYVAFIDRFRQFCVIKSPPLIVWDHYHNDYRSISSVVRSIYPTLSVQGITYPEVTRISSIHQRSPFPDSNQYYFSKGHGLIKLEIFGGEGPLVKTHVTYNLLRSHIVQ